MAYQESATNILRLTSPGFTSWKARCSELFVEMTEHCECYATTNWTSAFAWEYDYDKACGIDALHDNMEDSGLERNQEHDRDVDDCGCQFMFETSYCHDEEPAGLINSYDASMIQAS